MSSLTVAFPWDAVRTIAVIDARGLLFYAFYKPVPGGAACSSRSAAESTT
jgi:hypothetical protein